MGIDHVRGQTNNNEEDAFGHEGTSGQDRQECTAEAESGDRDGGEGDLAPPRTDPRGDEHHAGDLRIIVVGDLELSPDPFDGLQTHRLVPHDVHHREPPTPSSLLNPDIRRDRCKRGAPSLAPMPARHSHPHVA